MKIVIEHHHIVSFADTPAPARVLSMLAILQQKVDHMSQQLDDLVAEVARNTSVDQSAIALISGFQSRLAAIAAELAAANVTSAALETLRSDLAGSSDQLAAAVAAGTPAAPTP